MKKSRLLIALLLIVTLMLSIVLTACGGSSTPTTPPAGGETEQKPAESEEPAEQETEEPAEEAKEEQPVPTEFNEAPMLAEMVKEGKLPKVEERLPKEPKVTNEMPAKLLDYEIGKYGGVLRTVTHAVDWDADVFVACNEALLNTPGILGEEITPNVLKGYEVSDDQKEFTFYMREGLKWSDGQPVTTEDVRFTYEDVLLNEELTPVFPNYMRSGNKPDGTPMKLEIIDEYTFKISFDEPYGGFLLQLAIQGWKGYTDLLKPKHYLQNFHPKYTSEEKLNELIKENEFETWVQLFNFKDITNWELTRKEAIGFPVLYPWMLVSVENGVYTFERNPYYFKVDPAGNQLPYIDKIVSTQVQDAEMAVMKQIAGEVDFARETMAMNKMPLYKENEKNGYTTYMAKMHVTPSDIFLNLTYDDPVWRQVVQDKRFRQALCYAIDYDEIVDSVYYGFAEPSKMIPSEYNPDKANQLLDEMGLDKKDSEGFRLGPDGKRFTINFEIQNVAPDIVPLTELVVEFWKNVGIHTTMKTIDSSLWSQRNSANELQATVYWSHTPLWYHTDWCQSIWAPLWNRWNAYGGKQPETSDGDSDAVGIEEPPAEVKAFYDEVRKTVIEPPEKAQQANENLRKMMYDNIFYFVHVENVQQPFIANSKLGNVSDKGFAIATNFSAEQFFYKE